MPVKILAVAQKCLISVINRLSQNTMVNLNKLVIGKFTHETKGVAIEQFVELKMYSFLVDNNGHEKAKDVNKNVVATISHNEYKNVLLNKKCVSCSMNWIQSKDHRTETHEINKHSFPCFDDTIFILNNGNGGLALVF